jgi:hypothetical protein
LRQALSLIGEFLKGRDWPAQKAQALLQFGYSSGQLLRPIRRRPRQPCPQPAQRAKQHQNEDYGRNPPRQTNPLKRSHRRLQHEAEHEGEHDREDDLGCHITGGKHRHEKEAAEKYRLDIRRYRQIVFVSTRSSRRRGGRGAVSCLSAREQFEFFYRRHRQVSCNVDH